MESIEKLCEQLGSKDQVEAYRAFRKLSEIAAKAGAPGSDADRALVSKALAGELVAMKEIKVENDDKDKKSEKADKKGKDKAKEEEKAKVRREIKHSEKARNQIAQVLALVGGKDEVGALKEALRELGVREMARWALDRIDCAEATEALIDAAGDVGPEFRVGVVGALSHKTGGGVLKALKKLTTDSDGIVRIAAGEALGNYGDAAADEPIATLCKRASGRARQRLVRARLRLAENLVRGGDQSAGKRIYQAILADNPPPAQQRAAQAALDHLA